MKNVIIFDSYARVYDENGMLLHDASCSEIVDSTDMGHEAACNRVNDLFEATKLLGSYTEITSDSENGVVEIKVEFADKRKLHRVIYLKNN